MPSKLSHARKAAIVAGLAGASALVLTGCAAADPSPTSPAASAAPAVFDDMDDAIDSLVDTAESTGQTSITVAASTTTADAYGELASAFEAAYPGIDVQIRALDGFQAGSIIATELQAGQPTVDLIATSLLVMKPLTAIDAVDTGIDWAALGVPEARIPDGLGTPIFTDSTCGDVIYNTDSIAASDLPADISGFADPAFTDTMSTLPTNAPACLAFFGVATSADEIETLGADLVANGLVFSQNAEQLMLSGERPIIPFHYSTPYAKLKAEGAPVGRKLYPGTGVFRVHEAVLNDSKAPDAATAFALWMMTEPAQTIYGDFFHGGYGFIGDDGQQPSLLRTTLIDEGYDPDDSSFFVVENADNWEERVSLAGQLSTSLVG